MWLGAEEAAKKGVNITFVKAGFGRSLARNGAKIQRLAQDGSRRAHFGQKKTRPLLAAKSTKP